MLVTINLILNAAPKTEDEYYMKYIWSWSERLAPISSSWKNYFQGKKTFEESIFLTENLSENFSKWEGGKGELFKLHSIAFY